MAATGCEPRYSSSRILLPADRIPHLQIDLPAPDPGRADGVCRCWLAHLSVTNARKLSVPLQSGLRHPRGTIADAMAPRDGRERSTMEGAGWRSTETPMKAAMTQGADLRILYKSPASGCPFP
jgi:hypothetical protein